MVALRPEFALLRENNRRKGFFEPDHYRALLKHMPSYLKPVIQTAYITGWPRQVGDPEPAEASRRPRSRLAAFGSGRD
jgi:hypothetical protein